MLSRSILLNFHSVQHSIHGFKALLLINWPCEMVENGSKFQEGMTATFTPLRGKNQEENVQGSKSRQDDADAAAKLGERRFTVSHILLLGFFLWLLYALPTIYVTEG